MILLTITHGLKKTVGPHEPLLSYNTGLNFYFAKFTGILHIEKIVTSEKKIILGNYTGALTLSCTFSTPATSPRIY